MDTQMGYYIPAGPQAEEVSRCVLYLSTYNKPDETGKRITKTDIARQFGVSRNTLRAWISKWEQDGTMEMARQIIRVPQIEEIHDAVNEVVDSWPAVVRHMLSLAKGEESNGARANPRTQWEIAAWLEERYIAPTIAEQVAAGSKEKAYAEAIEDDFDVLDIVPKPKQLD